MDKNWVETLTILSPSYTRMHLVKYLNSKLIVVTSCIFLRKSYSVCLLLSVLSQNEAEVEGIGAL